MICVVSINEFAAFDIRVGKIVEVGDIEGARKPIYRLKVEVGELGVKNVAAMIKEFYTPEQLLGRSVILIANLDPKNIANFISEGMILAAESVDGKVTLLKPDADLPPGSKIR
jgi:export-related chaperone CsaA